MIDGGRRVWTRREIDQLVEEDQPEGSKVMFRVAMSPRLLLLLMEYQGAARGERVELVSVGPDQKDVGVRFFYRDSTEETK